MKNQPIKERLKPPYKKIREEPEISGKKTKAAGSNPERECEERNKIEKTVTPKEYTRINGFPNTPAPQSQGAGFSPWAFGSRT